MPEFQLRTASLEDIASVVALDRATELLPHWPEAVYVAALSQPDGSVYQALFVALMSGAVVGFAAANAVIAENSVMAELESVAVARSARRMGVASALCAEVIKWARSRGAKQIDLEVRSRSAGAVRLYEMLGFVAVGRRPEYYRDPDDDALLMRLEIGD